MRLRGWSGFIIQLLILAMVVSLPAMAQEATHSPSPQLQLTNEELVWLKNHPLLRFSGDPDWLPLESFTAEGAYQGVVAEYLRLIEERSGIHFTVIPSKSWNDTLHMSKNHEVDIVSGMESEYRKTFLNFTRIYFEMPIVIVTRKAHPSINDPAALKGYKVAIPKNYGYVDELRARHGDLDYIEVPTITEGLRGVSLGRYDAFIESFATCNYKITELGLNNLKVNGDTTQLMRLGFGVRNDWPELVSILNKAMDAVPASELNAIKRKWMAAQDAKTDSPSLQLTDAEWKWLSAHPLVKVAVDPIYPPIEYQDEEGRHRGITGDFLELISERLGVTFEPAQGLTWNELIEGLRTKNLDMFSALSITEERKDYMSFTEPYFNLEVMIFGRDDHPYITNMSELAHGKTAIVKGHATITLINRDYPELEIVEVVDVKEGLQALASGRVDHYIDSLIPTTFQIQKLGFASIQVSGQTPYSFPMSMAIRKDWPELEGILNKALRSITDEERNAIFSRWRTMKVEYGFDYSLLWKLGIPSGFLLLTFFFWNRRLDGAVKARTFELSKITERLALATQSAKIAVWDWDLAKGHLEWDDRMYELFGVTRQKFPDPQVAWENIVEPVDRARCDREIQAALTSTGDGFASEFRVIWPDGSTRHIESHADVHRDESGKSVRMVGMNWDISARKRAEQELMEHLDGLEGVVETRTGELQIALQKAESATRAKSDFLANMSHEIRTPMNAIIGMNHLLLKSDMGAKQRNYVKKMGGAAHNLLRIINDILDFSKIEAGKLDLEAAEFELNDVFIDLADLIGLKAHKKGMELVFATQNEVPSSLIGDPLRLGQILLNLCSNAVKFSDTGDIVIEASCLSRDETTVTIKFSVRDQGVGLSPEQQDGLFVAFSQADASITRKYGGTGLGLTICKKLVEMMGGTIGVESQLGEGSTFWFTIVFGLIKNSVPTEFPLPLRLCGLKVLILDDNDKARQVLRDSLASFGFEVHEATSGAECLASLETMERADEESYGLVLLDWRLPDQDGLQTALEIHRNQATRGIPRVLMVTAYGREQLGQKAQEANIEGFLVKPYSRSTLFDTLMEVFGHVRRSHREISPFSAKSVPGLDTIRGAHLLLVEDKEVNQEVACGILEGEGFKVSVACNGKEALEMVLSQGEGLDLILMDLQMPEMDGYTAAAEIRKLERFDQLPILAMTADALSGVKERTRAVGMNGYATKPIDPPALFAELVKWIRPRAPQLAISVEPTLREPSSRSSIPELPGLEIQEGLSRLQNNSELYIRVLEKFYRHQADSSERLTTSLAHGHVKEARRLLHSLKGVVGSISAPRLFKVVNQLDSDLKNSAESDHSHQLKSFQRELETVILGLKTFFSTHPPDLHSPEAAQLDVSLQANLIKALEKRLIDNDTKAIKTLQELRHHLPTDGHAATVDELSNFLRDYEFEKALETLNRLKTELAHTGSATGESR